MFETPSGPWVSQIVVDHDQRDDLLERDRHHGEIVPAEPQRRHAEQCAGQQRDDAAAAEAEPVTQMQ